MGATPQEKRAHEEVILRRLEDHRASRRPPSRRKEDKQTKSTEGGKRENWTKSWELLTLGRSGNVGDHLKGRLAENGGGVEEGGGPVKIFREFSIQKDHLKASREEKDSKRSFSLQAVREKR